MDPNFSTLVVSKDQLQNPDRGRRLRQEQALDLDPSITPTFPLCVCLSWRYMVPDDVPIGKCDVPTGKTDQELSTRDTNLGTPSENRLRDAIDRL